MSQGDIFVLGVSHRTSPVELREKLAVAPGELDREVKQLISGVGLREGLLISTCNRVEVYGVAPESESVDRVRAWLGRSVSEAALDPHLYRRTGGDAVLHAFRVASSLDSMVVGEPQILGQIKEAYAAATRAGVIGGLLERCFTKAFAVAKRVRTETGIASGSVSVSSIACDLAKKIFGDLSGKRVLLVGAGKMGESAAKHLRKQGATLFVANRSRERAMELASACGGEPRSLAELPSELALADVAISSTGSERFVITPELMKDVVRARKYRPLFLIDIAVPRDVDPRVGEMDSVFLYDVDDLQKVAQENLSVRKREAEAAERIVLAESREFEEWRRQLDLKPLIVALREHVSGVLRHEVERTLPRMSGDRESDERALSKMVDAMTNKLLHHAITELRKSGEAGDGVTINAAKRLFALSVDGDPESPETLAATKPGVGAKPARRGGAT